MVRVLHPQICRASTTRTSWHVGTSAGAMRAATVWLLLLVAQNTSKTLIMRAAVGQGQPQFLYSAAVLATEALKASVSIAWVLMSGGSLRSIAFFLRAEWRLFLRVMVPAAIYNCQQMLEFVALSRLEAPVFSIIVQTKLLTTALFSVIMLRKRLARPQVIALVLLMVGVILAQMKDGKENSILSAASGREGAALGVVATLGIATLSGFAAVYTEMVLKRGKLVAHKEGDMLTYMQIHMALASMLTIGVFAVGAPTRPPCPLLNTPAHAAAVCGEGGSSRAVHARAYTPA